ncbi:hypothetical protein KSD_42440 [Ktedonobacter sp. SOSP1-85]|uniref:class I SAM-dependent methyltransferase n=1 Tax=Ktedonobacter sp. SOSP1-85 TaxID=2778367 RepID=UPI0019166A0E|nr:hypothetical protein [Ktedonobacter sp. SOSP1-85]GHO76473.1 hypothetical protein KSD_42440 [Ktedonobacter sp. SOSP1-85]
MFLIGLAIIIFLTFGLTMLRGAPYLPAHYKDVEAVLKGLELKPGDLIVDLGSGDGTVLLAAARQGLVAYGYEINPLLCIIGWLRCRHYGKQIKILWRDFWFIDLPPETKVIFIFAAGPYMKGLARKFSTLALQHGEPFYVASYGFSLPQVDSLRIVSGTYIYRYN